MKPFLSVNIHSSSKLLSLLQQWKGWIAFVHQHSDMAFIYITVATRVVGKHIFAADLFVLEAMFIHYHIWLAYHTEKQCTCFLWVKLGQKAIPPHDFFSIIIQRKGWEDARQRKARRGQAWPSSVPQDPEH